MPTIVKCSCGTKVRLPDNSVGKMFRCPKCRTEFMASAEEKVVRVTEAPRTEAGALCPICQSAIAAGEIALICPDCQQSHHRECWAEVCGCSTYGCPQAPAVSKDADSGPPLAAWGDMKSCPACGEKIKAIAVRCRYCGTDFDTVDPLTAADLRRQTRKKREVQAQRPQVIALFVCSLCGCLAPLTLIFGLAWFLPNRKLLAKAGPFYLALGYSAIAVSLLYSILIVFFLAFSRL